MISTLEEKKNRLSREIDALQEEFNVELPKRIEEARSLGDLRENSEYDAARERQGFVKARISQLSEQLSQLSKIAADNVDSPQIGFGCQVFVLERNSNTRSEFTIALPNAMDPEEGEVSLTSPVGRALQNRSAGEEVVVRVPAGEKRFLIEKVVSPFGTVYTA